MCSMLFQIFTNGRTNALDLDLRADKTRRNKIRNTSNASMGVGSLNPKMSCTPVKADCQNTPAPQSVRTSNASTTAHTPDSADPWASPAVRVSASMSNKSSSAVCYRFKQKRRAVQQGQAKSCAASSRGPLERSTPATPSPWRPAQTREINFLASFLSSFSVSTSLARCCWWHRPTRRWSLPLIRFKACERVRLLVRSHSQADCRWAGRKARGNRFP